jgi:uncharacterized membrane protein SirB2
MLEFYPEIRIAHIIAVLVSGGLFTLRGIGLMIGKKWPMITPVRYLTYTVDTVLLTAALMLMTIVRQYPFTHGWLTVKVVLLIVYIFLGAMAFRRRRSTRVTFGFWLSALLIYAFVISVARAHHPLGILAI